MLKHLGSIIKLLLIHVMIIIFFYLLVSGIQEAARHDLYFVIDNPIIPGIPGNNSSMYFDTPVVVVGLVIIFFYLGLAFVRLIVISLFARSIIYQLLALIFCFVILSVLIYVIAYIQVDENLFPLNYSNRCLLVSWFENHISGLPMGYFDTHAFRDVSQEFIHGEISQLEYLEKVAQFVKHTKPELQAISEFVRITYSIEYQYKQIVLQIISVFEVYFRLGILFSKSLRKIVKDILILIESMFTK